jgi:hypothetical protein
MATVAELEARLEALKAQRDSAVVPVSCDGRSVEYRGTAEIARAIAQLVGPPLRVVAACQRRSGIVVPAMIGKAQGCCACHATRDFKTCLSMSS